jgi:hypothetical protein
MDRLFALAAFLLSLFGCDVQRGALPDRELFDVRQLMHAHATLASGIARIGCLSGASRLCDWTLPPARCAEASRCTAPPLQRPPTGADAG